MIMFLDGPAKGTILSLERAPVFLRVCIEDEMGPARKVDALDQRDDAPRDGERLYAYVLAKIPNVAFMRPGGRKILADYQLCPEQPEPGQMLDRERWEFWCGAQAAAVPTAVIRYMLT